MPGDAERLLAHRPGQRRYWAVEVDEAGGRAWLDRDEAHHALHVVRHRPGERLEVIDGTGRLFEAVIEGEASRRVGERRLALRLVGVREPGPEAGRPAAPWLAQALIRPSRLEALADSATQLGTAGLVLYASERSLAPALMGEARRERLLRILRAATAQSLGLRLPELRGPVPFTSLLEALRGFEVWVAHGPRRPGPDPDPAPAANLPPILVVGPEGGLTDLEAETLVAGGARLLDLGPRRLRAETAAVAGLAVLGAGLRAAASAAGAAGAR